MAHFGRSLVFSIIIINCLLFNKKISVFYPNFLAYLNMKALNYSQKVHSVKSTLNQGFTHLSFKQTKYIEHVIMLCFEENANLFLQHHYFIFSCQQHHSTTPTEIKTLKLVLTGLVSGQVRDCFYLK
jgi:hypothetical protein